MDEDVQRIELAGVELPFVRIGQGNGPTVVLLHGGQGPLSLLPAQLSPRFDVIAPIHPGFAASPIPEHFDALEDLVYLYLDFLDALALEDVALVGFSMGGWLAMELAVRSTARLARLVLVDSVGIKPGGPNERDIADVFALSHRDLLRRLYHDPARAPDLADATDERLAVLAAERTALALYTWDPYMHNPKLPHRLHRVDVPTRLIWGESDGIVSLEYARALQAMLPGAGLEVIPGAGHLPHLEQPAPFLDALLPFLT